MLHSTDNTSANIVAVHSSNGIIVYKHSVAGSLDDFNTLLSYNEPLFSRIGL
jgi:hypothetical protein